MTAIKISRLASAVLALLGLSTAFGRTDGNQAGDRSAYLQRERVFEKVPANAAGDEALAGGINPWHYWGRGDSRSIRLEPRAWRKQDDTVDGWDWSLPPSVVPASKATVRFGFHGWKRGIAQFNPPKGITVVDELWIRWREIEEEEGSFDFSHIEKEIGERLAGGCDGVLFRMLGAVWNDGTPEDWERWRREGEAWRFKRWSAPRWLVEKHMIDLLPGRSSDSGRQVTHVDIFHPVYHQKYLALIAAFERSGILKRPEVHGVIVCGMCGANGEEGHGTYELSRVPAEIAQQRHAERVRAWQSAFGRERAHKVATMLPDGRLMAGSRDGFVEMYHYLTDDPEMRGQYIDKDRYLRVNEDALYIKHGDTLLFGDENEEYRPRMYADQPGRPGRFGPVESFGYRYFTSMLRMLQMRRNYLYVEETTLDPQLLHYVLLGLGRKAESAPDAWCFLREGYLRGHSDSQDKRLKNFERWVYQRDTPGYETTPVIKIPHAIKKWWLASPDHRYDCVARRGKRIGFAVDDRFLRGSAQKVAVKVTHYDGYPGEYTLVYTREGRTLESACVRTTGRDMFRTSTFFIEADFNAEGLDFDFEIHSAAEVPVNFVRVIPARGH